ncbi:MAG: enoyl-CoA hydratase/isomerase family protein [Pseudomonadota bacterium]
MAETALLTTIDRYGVARLTLNRPEVGNALNEEIIAGICDIIGRFNGDPNVRVIVLTGSGDSFCSGADLNMMKRVAAYSADENKDDARRLAHMLHAINNATKPVIALINGPAIGGGVGVVAACDIAIASETAFFAFSEVKLGLIPAVISPFVIAAMRPREARRYFLTGERFDAMTARRMGLVHMVAMPEQINTTLDGVLDNLLAGGPNAQREVKSLINAVAFKEIDNSVLEDTANRIAQIRTGPEGQEGISAFLEKRTSGFVINRS